MLGLLITLSIPLLVVSLSLNGVGIGGQQVVGVVDALHEASKAGYPDDPATQVETAVMFTLNRETPGIININFYLCFIFKNTC